jgi:hypothetical protein
MLIFGALPGALSPAPHFRRLTVLAIGIDILKGAGLLSMAMVSLKLLPRRLALAMIIVALATYTHSEWDTFYYKTKITESTARNTPIAIVRHITASLKDNKAVTVVTAGQGNLLSKRELIEILQFELGYPKQLPDGVKLLELAEVVSPIKDAVIPIDAYHSIKNGQLNPLPLVALDNERIFSNRLGKTHVITDLNPKAAS